jgi:subtilisin-like proprotein convertase family protein
VGADEKFGVTASMNEVRADIQVTLESASGSVQIVVRDPSGDIRYDRTFSGGTSAQTVRDQPSWTPEEGDWTLTRAYTVTRGVVGITIWGEGLPPGTL